MVNGFTCACEPGFTGDSCQTALSTCYSSPCQNGATCLDMNEDYLCSCVTGYTGKRCEIDLYGLFHRNPVKFFHNVYKTLYMKASTAAKQLKQAIAIIHSGIKTSLKDPKGRPVNASESPSDKSKPYLVSNGTTSSDNE